MSGYWFRAHGYGLLGWRIWFAATFGPWFAPAFYVAPKWKRDKWHRIACDDPLCGYCASHYAALDHDMRRAGLFVQGVEGDSPSGS